MSTNDPLIGRTIDGYYIEKLLGSGGMAQVYRGYDPNLTRYVAIKVIAPHLGTELDYEERFKREARAIAQLRHPNIVDVYRFGQEEGLYYMAMTFIDGADLSWVLDDYRDEGELMDYNDILRVMKDATGALDYAHANGVIHRDVKPSNIMLNLDGDAILTDFGLVLMTDEGTRGEVFGSPHYMSPEQAINSAEVVPQSDLYSLGIVLYQMLTGSRPYNDGSGMQIAMAHIADPLPDPSSYNPNLHMAFKPVLEQALAKDPLDRFENGAEMLKALRAATREAKKDTQRKRRSLSSAMPLSSVRLPKKVDKYRRSNPLPQQPPVDEQGNKVKRDVTLMPDVDTMRVPKVQKSPPREERRPAPAVESVPAARPGQSGSAGGRRWLVILLLLVILAGGAGAFVYLDPLDTIGESAPPDVTTVIEGPVREIRENTLLIYDLAVVLPADSPLLDQISIGEMLWLEGSFTEGRSRIVVDFIHTAGVEDEILIGGEEENDDEEE